MNILFVIASLGVGGAQSFLLRLLSEFPQEHNIFLYDLHPKQKEQEILSNLTKDITIFSSPFERLEIKLKKYPLFFTKILNKLNSIFSLKSKIDKKYFNNILQKYKIEIINSHMYLADSFVANFCEPKITKISSFHGCYNFLWDKKSYQSNFENIKIDVQKILNTYDAVISAADRHNEVFTNFEVENKIKVKKIYYGFPDKTINPINLKQKYFIPDNSFIFGMVARGDISKGWQEAINSFEKLQSQFSNIFLILCGGTEYLNTLKDKYKQNKNIIFTGNINNPLNYIINFNVGLLPTYFPAESLPNTIIEYLYCGKPVIATRWAEIPQMIEYENNMAGKIVELTNNKADLESLYSAMKFYIEHKEELKLHSELAKLAFHKFEMQKCVNNYIGFFREILKK